MKHNLLPLIVLGLAAGFVLTRPRSPAPGEPISLFAGHRYLFIVRLSTNDTTAEAVLTPKDVEGLTLSKASNPPPWATPGASFSNRVAAFRFTARGNSTVELGQDIYGIGQLENVVQLSGNAEEPLV